MLFDPSISSAVGAASSSTAASFSYRTPEFIAVILAEDDESQAGQGDDDTNSVLPRLMQPVDGKPRIEAMLRWLEDSGLNDAVILAPEWQHAALTAFLRSRKSSTASAPLLLGETDSSIFTKPPLRIELDVFDIAYGESRSLQAWAERTTAFKLSGVLSKDSGSSGRTARPVSDLIILPSGFMSHFKTRQENPLPPLSTILDKHRLDEDFVTALLYEKKAPTDKKARKEAETVVPLVIAYDSETSTLLDIREMDEYEETVDLRSSLLQQFPVLSLTTVLSLAHVYVCSPRILAMLSSFPDFKSFEEQALPWICKAQWQKGLLAKGKRGDSILASLPHSRHNALARSTTQYMTRSSRQGTSDLKIACIIHR